MKPLKPNTFLVNRVDIDKLITAEGPGDIGPRELEAVKKVIAEGVYTLGPFVKKFEEEFEQFLGVKYAFAVNTCTTALEIAAKLVGIRSGDEVILPSISFVATGLPLRNLGAKAIFVDIDPDTFNICPEDLKRKITSKTKAIFVVHEDGHPVDMDPIMEIARSRGIRVVEDCAHALGVKYKGRPAGTIGDIGCFSFQAKKMLTTFGEGGMVTTNNDEYGSQVGTLRQFGWAKVPEYRNEITRQMETADSVTINGYAGGSYQMTDVQAAVGSVQLRKLPRVLATHRKIAAMYNKALPEIDGFSPPLIKDYAQNNYFRYRAFFDPNLAGIDRYALSKRCVEKGVQCGIQFVRPLYTFQMWREVGHNWGECPVLEKEANRTFYLPIYLGMKDCHVKRVLQTLKECIAELRRRERL